MRKFNGYMEYRFVCNNCDEVFDKSEVKDGEVCPVCKEGDIKNKSKWISPEEQRERYYDYKADEYCDNGGEW